MSEVERRGSESCPIDLTEDDSPESVSKKQRKRWHKDFKAIRRRLKRLETEMNYPQKPVDYGANSEGFVNQNEAVSFVSQCQDLKNRIHLLESWSQSMCQVFLLGHEDRKEEDIFEVPRVPSGKEVEADISQVSRVTEQETSGFGLGLVPVQTESNEVVPIRPSHKDQFLDNIYKNAREGSLSNYHQEPIQVSNHTDSRPCSVRLEQICDAGCDSDSSMNKNCEKDNNDEDQVQDLKPDIQAAYEKINLWRDDQGRILLFLYCTARRLRPNSSSIAGVSGMYLIDELHNEFGFISQQAIRDVKIEAEIRAALFGIETVKSIFKGSLGDVCVMIISSCPVLVQAMKADRIYPRFYSCSCHFRDCEHSETRWITDHPIGKSHIAILPDLMVSMKTVRVHWCKLENVSDEEKQVVSMYRNVVDAWLSEYIKIQRRKYPAVMQAQPLAV